MHCEVGSLEVDFWCLIQSLILKSGLPFATKFSHLCCVCLLVNVNCSGVLCQVGFLNATLIHIITNNVNCLIICSSLSTPNC